MRSIATCYSEHAIKVSDSYCSGSSSNKSKHKNDTVSIPTQVTCSYRITLSETSLLVTLTWHRNLTARIRVAAETDAFEKLIEKERSDGEAFSVLGRKLNLSWDFSDAKYEGQSPEPVNGFYLVVSVNGSELGFVLGDKGFELGFRLKPAKFTLVSKTERLVSCSAFYATRARFCDDGTEHEIVIKCVRDEDYRDHVLCVCIDKRSVFEVKRLKWNFRGNEAIFMDGLVVDVMWDVHDWFFNTTSGCAVFMFRTRSGLNTRLWLEEKMMMKKKRQEFEDDNDHDEDEKSPFSLLICACKKS